MEHPTTSNFLQQLTVGQSARCIASITWTWVVEKEDGDVCDAELKATKEVYMTYTTSAVMVTEAAGHNRH